MQVIYLKHNDIDYTKWDDCIARAYNSLIYAQTWYLDIVSPAWEALVSGDYECVMPLPVKRKFGFSYLAQPALTQQLGIFSEREIDEKTLKSFIRKLPYWSYHLNLNEENAYAEATVFPNYVLDLSKTYAELYANFSKNARRNIDKAREAGVVVKTALTPKEFLNFYYTVEKNYAEPNRIITKKLIESGCDRDELKLYGAYNQNCELIAALGMPRSEKRLTYLLPVSNEDGKRNSAMFAIIDNIIRNYAASSCVFDFEGSRIEGIARFYKGFGGENKAYYCAKRLSVNFLLNHINHVFKK